MNIQVGELPEHFSSAWWNYLSADTAGQLLAPTEFETPHVSVAPGRVQVTIPVDPYTASGGQVGPGDTVVIYASPKQ